MTREDVKAQLAKCPLEWSELGEPSTTHERLMAPLIHEGCFIGTYYIDASYPGLYFDNGWYFTLRFEHKDTGDIDVVLEMSSDDKFPELGIILIKQEANAHRIGLLLRHLGIKEKQI